MKFEEKVKVCSSCPHGLVLYIRIFLKSTHLIITSHTIVFAYLPNTEGLAAGWDLVKVLESLWWIWEDLCADGEFEDEPKIPIDI